MQLPKGIEDTLLMKSAKREAHVQFQAVWDLHIYSAFNAATTEL